MTRPLWQLLLDNPAELTCEECFAVMEYYAEQLAWGGIDLLPKILERLSACPECEIECRRALHRLVEYETDVRA